MKKTKDLATGKVYLYNFPYYYYKTCQFKSQHISNIFLISFNIYITHIQANKIKTFSHLDTLS